LSGADLREADLSQAVLSQAKLVGANLHRIRLQGADLTNADLTDANLYGIDLREAITENTLFEKAKLCNTILPDGKVEYRDCKEDTAAE